MSTWIVLCRYGITFMAYKSRQIGVSIDPFSLRRDYIIIKAIMSKGLVNNISFVSGAESVDECTV